MLLMCLAVTLPSLAAADPWAALREPGAFALMRHALAPGTGDPAEFRLGDCTTQRNLDQAGRDQAQAIGAAIRDAGIRIDQVLTSQWCRCRDTAALLDLAPPEDAPALNSFYRDFSKRAERTAEAHALIAGIEGRVLLVTHQVNISALTGRSARSGEVLILRATETGLDFLGSVLIRP